METWTCKNLLIHITPNGINIVGFSNSSNINLYMRTLILDYSIFSGVLTFKRKQHMFLLISMLAF